MAYLCFAPVPILLCAVSLFSYTFVYSNVCPDFEVSGINFWSFYLQMLIVLFKYPLYEGFLPLQDVEFWVLIILCFCLGHRLVCPARPSLPMSLLGRQDHSVDFEAHALGHKNGFLFENMFLSVPCHDTLRQSTHPVGSGGSEILLFDHFIPSIM